MYSIYKTLPHMFYAFALHMSTVLTFVTCQYAYQF